MSRFRLGSFDVLEQIECAIATTIVKIAAAGGIGASVLASWRNRPFALVVVWAAFGIASNQSDTPLVSGAAWLVITTLLLMIAVGALSWGGVPLSGPSSRLDRPIP